MMKWGEAIADKVHTKQSLTELVSVWKKFGETVVFTNGCFDILHKGHLDYLAKAADLGNRLIIGVNTDRSVREIKGPNRPVIDEETRSLKLASLAFVDAVVLFDEDTPLDLIKSVMPNILAKGGDYNEEQVVGGKEVKAEGGRVYLIPFVDGHSTTSIIDRLRNC